MALTIPDVIDKFIAYRKAGGRGAWGCLHVVLDDSNVADVFCNNLEKYADGDPLGIECAGLLRGLSRTQRGKLARMVDAAIAAEQEKLEAEALERQHDDEYEEILRAEQNGDLDPR
jgi:hypothetical protein